MSLEPRCPIPRRLCVDRDLRRVGAGSRWCPRAVRRVAFARFSFRVGQTERFGQLSLQPLPYRDCTRAMNGQQAAQGFRPGQGAQAAIEYSCAGQSHLRPHLSRSSSSPGLTIPLSPHPILAIRPYQRCFWTRAGTPKPDCAASNEIRAREPIRCRECGCRVMYKKRIKRSE